MIVKIKRNTSSNHDIRKMLVNDWRNIKNIIEKYLFFLQIRRKVLTFAK